MKKIFYAVLMLGGILSATSCVDDKYNLDDIDTTTAVKLDNLVVPVNLNTITLDEVLDIEDDDLISKFTDSNGNEYYAIQKGGEFNAGDFQLQPLVSENGPNGINPINFGEINIPGALSYDLPAKDHVEFTYLLNNVDKAVKKVNTMTLSPSDPMRITLNFSGMGNADIYDLKIYIPSMFVVYNYNVENNILTVDKMQKDGNGMLSLPYPIEVEYLDINQDAYWNSERGCYSMMFQDKIGIMGGKIQTTEATTVNPVATFKMSGFTANRISAVIDYEVENPEIPDVDLGDIPDFLADKETNLILQNPQLYIWISNPTDVPLSGQLAITPQRNGYGSTTFSTSLDFTTVVALSPYENSDLALYDEYAALGDGSLTPITFTGFQNILAGEGLPDYLKVELTETKIAGKLTDFVLAEDNGDEIAYSLNGKYTFFTPLAFEKGSKIIYSKSESDFFGGDMEYVDIDKLSINAKATTTLPIAATLIAKPLDKKGQPIPGVIAQTTLPANASNYDFNLEFNQAFTGLDGIYYEVQVNVEDDETLRPSQTITLTDIRATVSGQYVTKL